MSARDQLLDLFLRGNDGSQPEFEAALTAFEAEVLRRGAEHVKAVGKLDGEGWERAAMYAAGALYSMAERVAND